MKRVTGLMDWQRISGLRVERTGDPMLTPAGLIGPESVPDPPEDNN